MKKLKLSVFFIILLLLVSLGSAGFYFFSYESEKKVSKQLEKELNAVKDQKDKILKQLDQINKERMLLETKVKESDTVIAGLNERLEKEIQENDTLSTEQKTLQDKIAAMEQEKKKAEGVLNQKLQELSQLQSRLDKALSEKGELEKKVSDASGPKNSAEDLEKIVVTPPAFEPAVKEGLKEAKETLSGKVLLINKEYGFLVLDIGKPSGIGLGDEFEVFHENVSIGKVKAEKIHDTMSAANFLEDFKVDQVSEGDIANRIN